MAGYILLTSSLYKGPETAPRQKASVRPPWYPSRSISKARGSECMYMSRPINRLRNDVIAWDANVTWNFPNPLSATNRLNAKKARRIISTSRSAYTHHASLIGAPGASSGAYVIFRRPCLRPDSQQTLKNNLGYRPLILTPRPCSSVLLMVAWHLYIGY